MGKVREPKLLVVDTCFRQGEALALINALEDQGHIVVWFDSNVIGEYLRKADLIISPKAQMTPPGRLEYVVKKLKEIAKEVANGTSK